MAGRPEGAHRPHQYRMEVPPLLVASSSRPPAVPSGGQERATLVTAHKPWIEAQGEVPTQEAEGVKGRR